jgi:hypothetical protein
MKMKRYCGLALVTLTALTQAQAQFAPIPLTTDSYNYDVVVEKEGPHPFTPATTASMDGGTNNAGATWYEIGYNLDAPETGIPLAGSTIVSETAADHSYRMPASYTASNALLIDRVFTNGTLTVTTPAAYTGISLLASAANGAVVLDYTLHFSDGTTETGTVTAPDWFGGTAVAITANGRVVALSGAFQNVASGNPRLYSVDIPVTNTSKVLNSIELGFNSGGANGRVGVIAVSAASGGEFTPIAVTGFTQDMVVESTASHAAPLEVTTASLDAGTLNTGSTWYEVGYNTAAPTTGLPLAGTVLTNQAANDHTYRLAPSYTSASNAILVDSVVPTATITLATPASYSALSFLGSSGGGAVTLTYTITHTDSSAQTGTIVIPDWFNVNPYAYTTRGRVDVGNGGYSAVDTENPRLYSVDLAIERTSTPISNIVLTHSEGTGHATIMALSGTAGAVKPIFDVQPGATNAFEATSAQLIATVSGTAPITFQWQREVNGSFVNVANSATVTGANTATLSFSNLSLTNRGNYILIASNVGGSSTSLVTQLNVLSSAQDVTSPSDTVTSVGGNSPDNEPVTNAIDDTTSKYLNFGADGNQDNPYVGPSGLVVTPAVGSTVVTGLRIYTANDAVDRDPADFKLEGSTDGTTFTEIASGPLALPGGRNAAALPLDPILQPNQEVTFANTAGYTSYRLTFTNVKNNATVNSMQIGEIELLGTTGTGTPQGPRLQIARSGGNVTISWDGAGTLQATSDLNNPQWTTVAGSSPVTVPTSGTAQFFRVVR